MPTYKPGSTVPLKIELVDAGGRNVTATQVLITGITPSPAPGQLPPASSTFSFKTIGSVYGYEFDLITRRYPAKSYVLAFT